MKNPTTHLKSLLLEQIVVGEWSYNPKTGLVDVVGNVFIPDCLYMKKLPVAFGKVTGHFKAVCNGLNTLEGFPVWTGGEVLTYENPLRELNWKPYFCGSGVGIRVGYSSEKYQPKVYSEVKRNLIDRGICIKLSDLKLYYDWGTYIESLLNDKMLEILNE